MSNFIHYLIDPFIHQSSTPLLQHSTPSADGLSSALAGANANALV